LKQGQFPFKTLNDRALKDTPLRMTSFFDFPQ
jgi:hypothetical protein